MITIENEVATVQTPEGLKRSIPLAKLLPAITPPKLDLVLPNGVRMLVQRNNMFFAVYEINPGAYQLKWQDEPKEGHQLSHKIRTLALPYVILIIPFWYEQQKLRLFQTGIECYYRNEPLTGPKDKLYYPALLNCGHGHWSSLQLPSWICTSKMYTQPIKALTDNNKRLWKSIGLVRNHFFGAGFNYEWIGHWINYTKWKHASKRITNLDMWEKATRKDPSFVLNIDWMPAERNLEDTLDWTNKHLSTYIRKIGCFPLETIILNHR